MYLSRRVDSVPEYLFGIPSEKWLFQSMRVAILVVDSGDVERKKFG
jgi:hypothetical protein